jgi:hypothetical protein
LSRCVFVGSRGICLRDGRRDHDGAQGSELLADRTDQRLIRAHGGESSTEVPDEDVECFSGDSEPSVRRSHLAARVVLRAAEPDGDEGTEVGAISYVVDGGKPRSEVRIRPDSGIEVRDDLLEPSLAAELFVHSHAVPRERPSFLWIHSAPIRLIMTNPQ